MSNIMDTKVVNALQRIAPVESEHGKVIALSLVGNYLPTKVGEKIETMAVIKTHLILTMNVLDLAIMTRSSRLNKSIYGGY